METGGGNAGAWLDRLGWWGWPVTSSSRVLKMISKTSSFVICRGREKSFKERVGEGIGLGRNLQ